MSDNQTSLQLPHDLLSDDGQNITFRLSTAADWCIVVNYPLSSVIKLSELGKIRMIAPNQVIPLTHDVTCCDTAYVILCYHSVSKA